MQKFTQKTDLAQGLREPEQPSDRSFVRTGKAAQKVAQTIKQSCVPFEMTDP
jgi:hypothetical protein